MLLAETIIFAGLYSIPLQRGRSSRCTIWTSTSTKAHIIYAASGTTLEGKMISDIEEIDGVHRVSVTRTGDTFHVSVVIDTMDFPRFDAVVQKELQLYSEFPKYTFHFDISSVSELEEPNPASINAA